MDNFSIVVSTLFILLFVVLVITMVRYPREIFVSFPAALLKSVANRILSYLIIFTIPVWLPVYLLDKYFKWGLFKHPIFSMFTQGDIEVEDLPDKDYKEKHRLEIEFTPYSKYFLSTTSNCKKLIDCLNEGLLSIGKNPVDFECQSSEKFKIVKTDDLGLYEFQYLILWLNNEQADAISYGFATNSSFSFFGMVDKTSLNNIIGKTSTEDVYAFNLAQSQDGFLAIINKGNLKSKLKTEFFSKLINSVNTSGNESQKKN